MMKQHNDKGEIQKKVQVISDRGSEYNIIEVYMKQLFHKKNCNLRILEAGCGRHWILKLDTINYTLTGIDLDPLIVR